MASFLDWLLAPVTQRFGQNGETGVDLGVGFHTQVGSPFAGTVESIQQGPWGELVNFHLDQAIGNITDTSIVHMDTVAVSVGQHVGIGDFLGLSGGQLSGGSHPAQASNSSGPHLELDLWPGTPWQTSSINPATVLSDMQAAVGIPWPTGPILGVAGTAASGIPSPSAIGQGIASGLGSLGSAFLKATGVSTLKDLLWRALFIGIGIIVLMWALDALIVKDASGVIVSAGKAVASAG